jgi:hypothetical protein
MLRQFFACINKEHGQLFTLFIQEVEQWLFLNPVTFLNHSFYPVSVDRFLKMLSTDSEPRTQRTVAFIKKI